MLKMAKALLIGYLAWKPLAILSTPGLLAAALGLSGADAVTAALKTAMLHTAKPRVIAFEGSYHGLSYAPLAACGSPSSKIVGRG